MIKLGPKNGANLYLEIKYIEAFCHESMT